MQWKSNRVGMKELDKIEKQLDAMTATGIIGMGIDPLSGEHFTNLEDKTENERKLRE